MFFTGSRDPALLARARGIGSVVMKTSGSGEVLAVLTHWLSESLEPPQSRTAPSDKARAYAAAAASSLSKSRAQ
jgi:hypothetical protein